MHLALGRYHYPPAKDSAEVTALDLSYTYAAVTPVDRQLEYPFAHWNNYNLGSFGDFNVWGGD